MGRGPLWGRWHGWAMPFKACIQTRRLISSPSLGSSGGIKATVAGAIDIGLSSRDLKDNEQVDGTSARIFAYTLLAFVASVNTTINNVTTQDLVD